MLEKRRDGNRAITVYLLGEDIPAPLTRSPLLPRDDGSAIAVRSQASCLLRPLGALQRHTILSPANRAVVLGLLNKRHSRISIRKSNQRVMAPPEPSETLAGAPWPLGSLHSAIPSAAQSVWPSESIRWMYISVCPVRMSSQLMMAPPSPSATGSGQLQCQFPEQIAAPVSPQQMFPSESMRWANTSSWYQTSILCCRHEIIVSPSPVGNKFLIFLSRRCRRHLYPPEGPLDLSIPVHLLRKYFVLIRPRIYPCDYRSSRAIKDYLRVIVIGEMALGNGCKSGRRRRSITACRSNPLVGRMSHRRHCAYLAKQCMLLPCHRAQCRDRAAGYKCRAAYSPSMAETKSSGSNRSISASPSPTPT